MKLKIFKQNAENSQMSRKEMRKSAKKLKKMQARAFAQKAPIEKVMREDMGMTKEDKKKRKRKRQREAKKELKKAENREDSDESEAESEEEDEEQNPAKKRRAIVEVSVSKGKRKYGDESEDSDDDLTYEQYLEEVETAKKKRAMDQDGIEDDDAAIRKYGVLLGVDENKKERDGKLKVPKSMKSDGLDMLLDFCDSERRKQIMEEEGNEKEPNSGSDQSDEEEEENEDELDLSEGENDLDDAIFAENSDDEEDQIDDEEEEEEFDDEQETEENGEEEEEKVEKEDIYGRKINSQTGELIKFDPAAARKKLEELDKSADVTSSSAEQRAKVDRAVNSVINKLSDAMLVKSQQAIAELWTTCSKNDVKSALYKFLSKALLAPFRLQDSLLTTYGAFIAMCHSMVSNEISAHFVEVFMCDLVKSMKNEEEIDDDKSMENRVVFTAMLVVFRIIPPSILLEIITKFSENLNLTNLFAIRTLVAYAYKSLKKTHWSAVSEKIDEISAEFQKKPISALPRAKFLLEEVVLLKKAPPKAIDYTVFERQVKVLHGITKKKGSNSDNKELSMTLNDLLHADERGRWWIVGSAFRLPENGGYGVLAASNQKKMTSSSSNFTPEVVAMATKAGMNSEVRRQIFCSVASSEDEDDAFERLLKLSLKGEKERELVHVLIAMMMKEKSFNAFYAALLQRFCEFNRRFVITLQFALWDRIRECDSLKIFQRSSLAQLLHHLIANEVMSITVLKTVEWASQSSALNGILKKLFVSLGKCPESVLRRVFDPVIDTQKRAKFEMLSEGMRVFWHMHLKDSDAYNKIDKWIMESGYD